MNKLRWGKFYWSDWSDDPALASCSLAAQGLWMRLLCIAAQGTPYGHVTINGKPASFPALARIVRCRLETLERLIGQLERKGVCKRAASGALMCSRMEADMRLARARASAAKSRWDKDLVPDLHMQTESFASTESDANADAKKNPPRSPPDAGASGGGAGDGLNDGGGKRSRANGTNFRALGLNPRANGTNPRRQRNRNGMVDIILEDMEAERAAAEENSRRGGAKVVSISGDPFGGLDDP